MTTTVIGLGKIGLCLAVQFATQTGDRVIGCDINAESVSLINLGKPTFAGEDGLEARLAECVKNGSFRATTDLVDSVRESQVIVIVVPLIVDKNGEPEYENIDNVTKLVGQSIKSGSLVIYETTLPIGVTRQRFAPILERESGLRLGKTLFVAYSPERVYSGNVFRNLSEYPKLVGGVEPESSAKAVAFYESALTFTQRNDLPRANGVWNLGNTEAAEMAKLVETTYRDVNIGLANQFARHAETIGVDVYSVIESCNSQPFSQVHQPGAAVGGHCIPVYPHFYLKSDPDASIVRESRAVNDSMPEHMIDLLKLELGDLNGRSIVILGLAYRGGVKEHAFSGSFSLATKLKEEGAIPSLHDPLYSDEELKALGFVPFHFGEKCDAVVLHTNHKEYLALSKTHFPNAKVVIDGRNFLTEDFRRSLKTRVLGVGA